MAVPVGAASSKLDGMITLKNETAEYIWKCFEEETSLDGVVAKVVERYDIDSPRAFDAVKGFVDSLMPYGVFDEDEV
ncbi:MAG: PqqD family protein [Clostridia bacterium]|nr:PqqD family protein [Clostridia bacterium]